MFLCQFGQIRPLLQKIEHRQCFHRYMTLVTLKTRSRSPVSDHFYHSPDGVSVSSWSKPGHEYRRKDAAKVSKGAKISSRYNQVRHPTQDTKGKVTNSQLDTTHESQEVSPFPAGDHKAQINRRAQRHNKHKTEQKHK